LTPTLEKKGSNSNIFGKSNAPSGEKAARPLSLFRMGGKLFQDGSSKKKNNQENRVQSMSVTAPQNFTGIMGGAGVGGGDPKRSSLRFGQSTMKMMGNLALGSSFGGVKGGSGKSAPIGSKKGLGSQSGSLKVDDPDNASVSEMSTTSFDTTQATDDHDGQERTVNLSSIVITDVVTVAQILKMVLRDLPEPVVTFSTFDSLMSICLQLETKGEHCYLYDSCCHDGYTCDAIMRFSSYRSSV
jgi:hypothetical protein